MTTTFPDRVWERSSIEGLWTSRKPNEADYERRRLVSEMLNSLTTSERRAAIVELLRKRNE